MATPRPRYSISGAEGAVKPHARRCRDRRSASVQPPVRLVYRVDRLVVVDAAGMDDLLDLVVQDQRLAVDIDDKHGVRDLEVEVLQDDKAPVPLENGRAPCGEQGG